MLQKLLVRNVVDGDNNPSGGLVRGVGIAIDWQSGPLRDMTPSNANCNDEEESPCFQFEAKGEDGRFLRVGTEKVEPPRPEAPRHNGAFVEGVITAAIKRLEFYQASRFNCQENEDALDLLRKALGRLMDRTDRRTEAGTEGTHQGS
jgi:hypothetical protein